MEICLRAFYNADKDDLIGLYFSALNVWKGYEEGVKVSHSFYSVEDEKDKAYGYNLFSNQGSIYGGVMKIEDDKLYIDTMEIDVKKYNL